jgi:glycosyltransferase involved in cell wall biosynthesis
LPFLKDDWALLMTSRGSEAVLVACPDARPPAYQAVVGLARAGLLGTFLTGYYDRGGRARGRILPQHFRKLLGRRFDPEIPADRVRSVSSFDLALRFENRLSGRAKRTVSRWRTHRFDGVLAARIGRTRPRALLAFSDVGSRFALPKCRALGVPSILSMVHGDVREEREVLEHEAERSPDFFPYYLGDGQLDRVELDWLHERRLAELELANRVLVPSEHIAETLCRHGTPRDKVRVIPYAADQRRFRPDPYKRHGEGCTFLFAGGVCQRKGVGYLLEAWRRVRRPGWRLQLLGALPRDPGPMGRLLNGVDVLGRVGHAELAARMAAADIFVFPSLFEGSAVVTYEALASGLPQVVTPNAGSVVRDGLEGFLVPAGDAESLAARMDQLGNDPALRAAMARNARARALEFDWSRYHHDTVAALSELLCDDAPVETMEAIV